MHQKQFAVSWSSRSPGISPPQSDVSSGLLSLLFNLHVLMLPFLTLILMVLQSFVFILLTFSLAMTLFLKCGIPLTISDSDKLFWSHANLLSKFLMTTFLSDFLISMTYCKHTFIIPYALFAYIASLILTFFPYSWLSLWMASASYFFLFLYLHNKCPSQASCFASKLFPLYLFPYCFPFQSSLLFNL